MLIPKKNRVTIYENLFNEGVMVAVKDFNAPKHLELEVPNLHVIKALQSLKSRGYVQERFSWRHYYWYLTNEGIEYLREYLHLTADVVPATLKKSTRPATAPRGGRPEGERREYERRDGDREGYRRGGDRPSAGAGDKKVGAGADFKPDFRGGFGRGRSFGGAPREGGAGGFRGGRGAPRE
eukprot:Opistho-1_new@15854